MSTLSDDPHTRLADDPRTRPVIALHPGKQRRAERGHPWIYSNEVRMEPAAKALAPGSVVTVADAGGKRLGVALFNPQPLVSLRLLDRRADTVIDQAFLERRLARARDIRDRLFAEPFYRLIHAEADGLPGLVIDRYGDALVCQLNSAGMDRLEPLLLAALDAVLAPETVVLRNDSPARQLEGLAMETRIAKGSADTPFQVRENGSLFRADLSAGQKTGWFFDQRPNRALVAQFAKGATVLDTYCFAGGFGVQAAVAGASHVTLLDRSEPALKLAMAAAEENGVAGRCSALRGEAFETLEKLHAEGKRFDIVVLDPPAFVKSKKDLGPGSRGYRKLNRLGAALVAPGGYLFSASCSHNKPLEAFAEAVAMGIADAGRTARLLHTGGAGLDHPAHPFLPESAYLKGQLLALD
jgi:23S rRNA (cytosine1962-C5)-methyltransferase